MHISDCPWPFPTLKLLCRATEIAVGNFIPKPPKEVSVNEQAIDRARFADYALGIELLVCKSVFGGKIAKRIDILSESNFSIRIEEQSFTIRIFNAFQAWTEE